jgi:hypothetical protein
VGFLSLPTTHFFLYLSLRVSPTLSVIASLPLADVAISSTPAHTLFFAFIPKIKNHKLKTYPFTSSGKNA